MQARLLGPRVQRLFGRKRRSHSQELDSCFYGDNTVLKHGGCDAASVFTLLSADKRCLGRML